MKELLIILIIILFMYILLKDKEYLINKPNSYQRNKIIDQILNNSNLFKEKLDIVRNKFDWIDAVTYEEIRNLYNNNDLNEKNIVKLLS